jgi:PAS domain S-box-containing protein
MKRKVSYEEIEKDIADLNGALKTIRKDAGVEKAINNIIKNVRFQATELKKKEEELKNTEAYMDAVVNCMSDLLIVVDRDLKWNLTNPVIEKFTGYKADECLGKPIPKVPFNTPETLRILGEADKRVRKGESFTVDVPIKRRDGTDRVVSTTLSALRDAKGNDIGTVYVLKDITELRKREEEQANAILSLSKVLNETVQGNLSARVDIKGWSEELATIGMSINTLIEILELEKKEKK